MQKKNLKKKNLHNKMVGFFIKKGKKSVATQIVNDAFLKVSKKTGLPMHQIFLQIFLKLNSFVETKKVRIRRSTHLVPFSITLKRRSYLILKWLLLAIKEDNRKVSITEKLATEVEQIISKNFSKSEKIRQTNIISALSNRSNIHFRW
jgi:small subunit ribosomal protein S7|tara:strand:+ start:32 stop:475 length:444 start_codon:yes stop_codon:yes gene_type:complete